MTKAEIIAAVEGLNKVAGAFYGFETVTAPKLLKKSRSTKEACPYADVTIRAKFSAQLGISYENCVNNALERAGLERNFEAEKPLGKHYVSGSKWLMQSDKDEGKFYLALSKVGGQRRVIMIGDREATEGEVSDLKANYLPVPSKANPFAPTWRTYGVEGILAVC